MKAYKTLLFIVSVILLLALISYLFPKEGVSFAGRTFYFPSVEDILTSNPEKGSNAAQRMQEMENSLRMDSIAQAESSAYQDSLSFYHNFFNQHPSRIYLPDNDWSFFDFFFQNLEESKEKEQVVHILHYGDSQIEGDRITGFIRQQLQEKFGGKGPGLLPAVQPIPSAAVGQTASGNINRYIIAGNLVDRIGHRRYGALGQVARIAGEGSIYVTSRNWKDTFENTKDFSKIRLYVGHSNAGFKASLIAPDEETKAQTVPPEKTEFDVLTWDLTNPAKKFTLRLSGSAEIYGIAVDGNYGVAVDNVPLRGSSGTFFTDIDESLMQSMLKDLNVGLIILEFGGNAMPAISGDKSVAGYKEKLSEQIAYFKTVYPDSKILLIGPADMSKKVGGKLQTYPFLAKMIQGMKEAAMENGAAFWDMYQVMGGENSMINWVNNRPSLAAPDYIHFTPRGADKIAEMFCKSFMIYYDYYDFQKRHKQAENNK